MNLIQQMLGTQRPVGGVVYDAVMAGDWSILSQFEPEHCAGIFPVPERIIAYHYVRRGRMTVCLDGHEPVATEAGTMVLFPRADPHVLCSSPDVPPTPAERVFSYDGEGGPNLVRIAGEGDECALFCGWLGLDEGNEALLEGLPPMLMATAGEAQGAFLSSSLRYAAQELGSKPELIARLSYVLFEEAVRRYFETLPEDEGRRLAALRDPALARAFAAIERNLGKSITLDSLASEAGVSRTVLGQRFAAAVGESPMRYVARRRMRRAAERLRSTAEPIARVAFEVGFSSEAAFSRAFKREFGSPPAAWREREAQA